MTDIKKVETPGARETDTPFGKFICGLVSRIFLDRGPLIRYRIEEKKKKKRMGAMTTLRCGVLEAPSLSIWEA